MQSVECQTILFLCTGNSCRSQMAEGFGRALAPVGFEILSAGTEPRGIHPKAIQVMAEVGIDIGSQNSQGLEGIDLGGLGLVVTLCDSADQRCPSLPAAVSKGHWPLRPTRWRPRGARKRSWPSSARYGMRFAGGSRS